MYEHTNLVLGKKAVW